MKLKNNALQELYETIVNGTFTFSPYAECPMDKAFRKCDEKLSESVTFEEIKKLENNIDILEKSNGTLLSANSDLASIKKKLEKEIEELRKHFDDLDARRDKWRARAEYAEHELERLRKAHDELFNAGSRKISEVRRENEAINKKLEKEIERLKKDYETVVNERNDLSNKFLALKEDRDIWIRNNGEKQATIAELKNKFEAREEELDAWTKKHIDILSASEREAISAKNALEKDLADAKVQLHYFRHSRDDWQGRAEYEEEQKLEQLRRADSLADQVAQLKKELDNLLSRAHWAEDDVEALKKDNEDLEKRLMKTTEVLEKVNSDRNEQQNDRDFYHGLYTELSKTYDKLSEDNKKLKARANCLHEEVLWYRKHYGDQSDKIQKLKNRLNSIPVNATVFRQGQTDLWDMLQNVNDAKPFELATCFPDVTCMDDILSWDLEDFLDTYKKWQEEKEKERLDHMRDYLARFCEGRVCKGCPLESNEFKCGCGYSFKKATNWDMKIIPDEELERYYEKARGCCRSHFTKPDDHCVGLRKKVEEACNAFAEGLKAGLASEVKEAPVSCDIPIKDLGSWERTLEVNVEINKDLLEKVCGVKLEEKKPKPGELVITTHGVVTGNYTEAALKDIKEAIKNFKKSLPALDSWEATIKGSIKDTK